MTAPKQPNLTTDEKQLISYLLEQEHEQVVANLRASDITRTSKNAHKIYKRHLAKTINKVGVNRYRYGADL